MKYSNRIIQEQYNDKENIKFIFFWRHQPSKDGSIIKSCFSQWWEAPFVIDNITYKTAEHYMMAEKARLFLDEENHQKILDCNHHHEAKKLGRAVKNFDSEIWDSKKYVIVYKASLAKFSQHESLKEFLLNTKDRVIVEASPVDNVWGIGMAKDHKHVENPNKWRGYNLLGYVLMEVRDYLNANE